jgi:hypothetical protein
MSPQLTGAGVFDQIRSSVTVVAADGTRTESLTGTRALPCRSVTVVPLTPSRTARRSGCAFPAMPAPAGSSSA